MKANNGILIIDDFGRQLMSPRDPLNRWIVPLDGASITSPCGMAKFQIRLKAWWFLDQPRAFDLADEFPAPYPQQDLRGGGGRPCFDQILSGWCGGATSNRARQRGISAETVPAEGRTELRACYPADICNILLSIGRYEGRPPLIPRRSWSAPRRCTSPRGRVGPEPAGLRCVSRGVQG
jgi:hypothetical protein